MDQENNNLDKEKLDKVSGGNLFITSCPRCGGELIRKFHYHSDFYTLICKECGYEPPYN